MGSLHLPKCCNNLHDTGFATKFPYFFKERMFLNCKFKHNNLRSIAQEIHKHAHAVARLRTLAVDTCTHCVPMFYNLDFRILMMSHENL